ncbi:DEKNAAC104458 [Brettanomyces naardenensis]|uniref:Glucose-6-phosphate 1-dehydrogenase n=1 Tax=Brettanomyces naardenensis TaxID=13370 RepID=A0A448YQV8_BRENA|nr:DEKNAAC104458 [Brettanomyces naardenensis]
MSPVEFKENTIIVVFGASGDLAKKKTFPALFGLFREGYLSPSVKVYGYARSKMTDEEFRDRIKPYFETPTEKSLELVDKFLALCSYEQAAYDEPEGYQVLTKSIEAFEAERGVTEPHRLFYLALPPAVFTTVAEKVKQYCHPGSRGLARLVVEKPFGRDLKTAKELQAKLAPLWSENELYRIDHYLGKEMVKNLIPLRFANSFLHACWNNHYITSVQISLKEPFGTEGRGGYFDNIGIIRDVIQNHLLQVLTLLTMERPISGDAEAIRDEKVHLLKAIKPLDKKNILVGQYSRSEDGKKPGYLDDETVKPGSKCITYAAIPLEICNERWEGVPIILRAGKALNEGKVEIRIQFKETKNGIYQNVSRNELVIRVQPNEAMYMKMNIKIPGVSTDVTVTDLDLTYSSRYKKFYIPQAYESLIRDVLNGDHSRFVRDDELEVSWALFTPLLNYLEGPQGPDPILYPYGARGPEPLSGFLEKNGYVYDARGDYQWPVTTPDTVIDEELDNGPKK